MATDVSKGVVYRQEREQVIWLPWIKIYCSSKMVTGDIICTTGIRTGIGKWIWKCFLLLLQYFLLSLHDKFRTEPIKL